MTKVSGNVVVKYAIKKIHGNKKKRKSCSIKKNDISLQLWSETAF